MIVNSAHVSTCTTFLLKAEQSQREVTVTAYLFTCIFWEVKRMMGKELCRANAAKNETHWQEQRSSKPNDKRTRGWV